jgi:hypothetical protein
MCVRSASPTHCAARLPQSDRFHTSPLINSAVSHPAVPRISILFIFLSPLPFSAIISHRLLRHHCSLLAMPTSAAEAAAASATDPATSHAPMLPRSPATGAAALVNANRATQPATRQFHSSEVQLSNGHRLFSAGIGALLTSLVVTPFG